MALLVWLVMVVVGLMVLLESRRVLVLVLLGRLLRVMPSGLRLLIQLDKTSVSDSTPIAQQHTSCWILVYFFFFIYFFFFDSLAAL